MNRFNLLKANLASIDTHGRVGQKVIRKSCEIIAGTEGTIETVEPDGIRVRWDGWRASLQYDNCSIRKYMEYL